MKELVLSVRARADLQGIWTYTAETWSPKQADTYVLELLSVCEDLAQEIRKGRPADDIRQNLFRSLAKSHVLYFQFEPINDLVIVRILHQSMDPSLHI